MDNGKSNEEICQAVYDTAERYVISNVKSKDILELDLGVSLDDGELSVELFLVTVADDDETITASAVGAAMEEGDRLMGKG